MDGLDAEAYDRDYDDRQLLSRILGYFRPEGSTMALVAVMVVLNSLMDAVLPILVAEGLDRLTRGEVTFDSRVWRLVTAFVIAGTLSWVFNYVRQSRSAKVVGDV